MQLSSCLNWQSQKCGYLCAHAGGGAGGEKKKETKLGLSAKKGEDFGNWYSEVVVESEMISYYDVSGAPLGPSCKPPSPLQLLSRQRKHWLLCCAAWHTPCVHPDSLRPGPLLHAHQQLAAETLHKHALPALGTRA